MALTQQQLDILRQKLSELPPEKKDRIKKVIQGEIEKRAPRVSGLEGVALGFTKRNIETLRNIGGLAQKSVRGTLRFVLPKAVERKVGLDKFGFDILEGDTPLVLKPYGTAEKFGSAVASIAQFLLPSGILTKAAKAVKSAGIVGRAGVEALGVGGVKFLQEGEFNSDVKTAAIVGAAFPVGGSAVSGVTSLVKKKVLLPTGKKILQTVIRPTARDIKDGFRIENVAKYNLGGSLQDVVMKSHIKMNKLSLKLERLLASKAEQNVLVDLNRVYQQTERELLKNRAKNFGENASIIRVLRNQLRKEIKEQSDDGIVDILHANYIKRGAGQKGAWAFGYPDKDATAIERVYTTFYRHLRREIDNKGGEEIVKINRTLSEIIPISNAALRRLPVEQRNNVLSLTDSMALFATVFDPRALAVMGATKLARSGRFANFLIKLGSRESTPKNVISQRLFGVR